MLDDAHIKRRRRCTEQTSASQIELYTRCPRKFYYSYIAGIRPEQTNAQREGVEVDDDHVQVYLKTGQVPEGKWAALTRVLIPHLPATQTAESDLLVQHPIRLPTYDGGPTLVGFPDMMYTDADGLPHVDDLKTTTDFRYCKSADELRDNTQMIAYARYVCEELGAERIAVAHVYGRRKTPHRAHRSTRPHAYNRDRECKCAECREWLGRVNRGLPVDSPPVVVTAIEIASAWGRRMPIVREMVAAATSCANANDLEPHTEECSAWGGCPHQKECGVRSSENFGGLFSIRTATPMRGLHARDSIKKPMRGLHTRDSIRKREEGNMEEKKMTLKEKLAAAKSARTSEPQPTTPASDDEAPPDPTAKPAGKGMVWTKYGASQPQGWIMRLPKNAAERKMVADHDASLAQAQAGGATGVLPPDSPSRESTPEEIEVLVASKKKKEKAIAIKCPGCKEKVSADSFGEHFTTCKTPQSEQTESAKSLQVKTVNLGSFAKFANDDAANTVAVEAPSIPIQIVVRKKPLMPPRLYFDCVPSKISDGFKPVMLSEWLGPIAEAAAAAHDVEDVRMIPYTSKGVLATALREALDTCPAVLLIRSSEFGADVAREVLAPYASEVWEGLR